MLHKKHVTYALIVVALAGASVAYSAMSPSAKLQKQDRVYGGGQFGPGCFTSTFCFGNPRNVAVDAHAQGDGSEAVGNSDYGLPGRFASYESITCLRVDGNHAAIGGVIDSGANTGDWFVQYFVDRGGPAALPGDRDLASPQFTDVPSSPTWPAGFPYTCPSPTTGFPGAEPIYLEVDEGDLVVHDAPND